MTAAVIVLASVLVAAAAAAQQDAGPWANDFARASSRSRPAIEARYTSAARTGFEIDAQSYRIRIDLQSKSGQRVSSLRVKGSDSTDEVLAGSGFYLRMTDDAGKTYSSLNTSEPSRVNIYRRGPYYIETHWLDVQMADAEGTLAPVKGEVVFYSYPEKTHIGVVLHVTAPIRVSRAKMVCEFDAETCATCDTQDQAAGSRLNDFALIKRRDNRPSCVLIYPVPAGVDEVVLEKTRGMLAAANCIYSSESHGGSPTAWNTGDRPSAYFELLPLPASEVSAEMEAEIDPLLSGSMKARSGRTLGYDPIRGCYKVQTDNAGFFSHHYYTNPNDYEVASFSIANNAIGRKVYILHETREKPGAVECGVVLDEAGNTLPLMVQTSKNFAGEKEEPFYNPHDTPFSETFFPLHLDAGETRALTSLHLYQNWGSHPLKQFSSLGAWMDYYHMSTGVTETTCYVPFLFGGLSGVSIADLRPMSQQMWESQPQHDNVAGHSFLRYADAAGWHYVEYTGTTWRSTGPNWADVSLDYVSDDGKARLRIDTFELPQTDELRNFIRMRIDFTDDIAIAEGDMSRNLRLLNISSWLQQLRYTTVAWGGPSGEPSVKSISLDDGFTVAGQPLPEHGWASIYPEKRGANAFVIRSFSAMIGGEPASAGVSAIGQKNGDTVLMLVPVTKSTGISAGDYIEAELFIMPYGGGTQDWKPAQKAAFDFGLNAPRVTEVAAGRLISGFPTRIALDSGGTAEFTVTGGADCIPVIVEDSRNYRCQRLYSLDGGQKALIDHARKGESDGYQVFVTDEGRYGWVFLVPADGKEHRYRVE